AFRFRFDPMGDYSHDGSYAVVNKNLGMDVCWERNPAELIQTFQPEQISSARFVSRDNRSPIGCNSAAQDGSLTEKAVMQSPAIHVPHSQRVVSRSRDNSMSIACNHECIDHFRMTFQRAN